MTSDQATLRFRDQWRAANIADGHSGTRHFAVACAVALGGVAVAAAQINAPTAAEWARVPAWFVFANLVEYLGHRYPMHRAFPGLGAVVKRHAGQHHRFFTFRQMLGDSDDDYRLTLFPAVLYAMFGLGVALPMTLLVRFAWSANAFWLFLIVAVLYFLLFEWVHLAAHVYPRSLLRCVPGIEKLCWHHQLHHAPSLMQRYNFNITFHVFDRVFGTFAPADLVACVTDDPEAAAREASG